MNQYRQLEIYTDGGARGNPGPAAIGVVVFKGDSELFSFGKQIGETTNNVAEYEAVLAALVFLQEKEFKIDHLVFYLDSLLVVQQLKGVYKTKKSHLQRLLQIIKKMEPVVAHTIDYQAIPREQNARADNLVNQALDNFFLT